MAGGDGGGGQATLERTPTYAVAIAGAIFIGISYLVERFIHGLIMHLKAKEQKPLKRVASKLTDELMLLGFISLLLTVFQNPLMQICVTDDFARHMWPCKAEDSAAGDPPEAAHRRLLGSLFDSYDSRRILSKGGSDYCERNGKTLFVSLQGLHQLHIFIFVLGVTHVTYSLVSVLLGFLRMYHWKEWEAESRPSPEKELTMRADLEQRICDGIKEKTKRSCSFLDRHIRRYENPVTLWTICFFQQFVASVSREDYLLFRVGFISSFRFKQTFDFHEYVMRTMELDLKAVIGISWWLWAFVVLFLLFNAYGWYTYFWASFIPTILVLIVGTKQQHIISVLALKAKRHALEVRAQREDPDEQVETRTEDLDTGGKVSEEHVETRTEDTGGEISEEQEKTRTKDIGHAVKPTDELFWFQRPRILRRLIHFVIFQNSLELAFLFWVLVTFGWNSCMLGHHTLVIIRITVGAATIFLSSYSIIPIYALVNQMGSDLKMEAVVGRGKKAALNILNSMIAKTSFHKWIRRPSPADWSARSQPENGSADGPSVPEDMPLTRGLSTRPQDALGEHFQKLYGKDIGKQRLLSFKLPPISRSEVTTNSAAPSVQDLVDVSLPAQTRTT